MFGRGRGGLGGSSGMPGAGRGPMQGTYGSEVCRCPRCGYSEPHVRGTPCSTRNCPKCGVPLRGERC